MGSTEVALWLPRGTLYFARLRPTTYLDCRLNLCVLQSSLRDGQVCWIHLDANGVASRFYGRQRRTSRAGEGIDHGITDEAEHPNETPRDLDRVGRRMISSELAGYVGPDRREQFRILFGGNERALLLLVGGTAVASGLTKQQDVLDIILD